uniref:RRM domain-containing protein n=1 Tax=Trypanosoma congolense (strain IL3000) TaxID=1068625 RepID=G0UTF2_TRYCI|nr:conserved hypothetical protein [Trypanosoma congolense IL3000]
MPRKERGCGRKSVLEITPNDVQENKLAANSPQNSTDEYKEKSESTAVTTTKMSRRKKREREQSQNAKDEDILHGSFIATNLPTRMDVIYTQMVRSMMPQCSRLISEATIMEETDGATLTFEVKNEETADFMRKRLHNATVCGRQWKVEVFPIKEVQCTKEACLVDVKLVPAASRSLVLWALNGAKGFLSLVDPGDVAQANPTSGGSMMGKGSEIAECNSDSSFMTDSPLETRGSTIGGNVDVEAYMIASFVDEGSAQNARAMLSGRLIGTSGVRMFLERHR